MLAAMTSADDASHGGDGAPLGTGAREPTPWFDRAIGGGGPRAPLETSVRAPTSWSDRANSRGGLRARFESGDDRTRDSTEESNEVPSGMQWAQGRGFFWALDVAIWCLDIMLDALQHIERRTRRETMVQSPV